MKNFFQKNYIEALDQTFKFIYSEMKISKKDLLQKSRKEKIAHARFVAWFILRMVFNMSYPKIAEGFKMDHSTVAHGVKKVVDKGIEKDIISSFLEWKKSTYPHPL